MPYEVRKTRRFLSFDENTSWLEAGKRPLAAAGTLSKSAAAATAAEGRALRIAAHRSVPREEWHVGVAWARDGFVASASPAARGDGREHPRPADSGRAAGGGQRAPARDCGRPDVFGGRVCGETRRPTRAGLVDIASRTRVR